MTYVYTKPAYEKLELSAETKVKFLKCGAIALLTTAFVATAFVAFTPKSKPTPLATQPAVIEIIPAHAAVETTPQLYKQSLYRTIDNEIRDFQIDNAKVGHKMKMAMKSDANPIRKFFIWADRKFSFMAILVGLAFLFTMVSFGFIRTSKDADLSNY